MILLQLSYYYLMTLILTKSQVASSITSSGPEDAAFKSIDSGLLALLQERDDPINFINSEPPGGLLATQSDSDTPSDKKPYNDISTFDQNHLEGDNILPSPSQATLVSASVSVPGGAEANKQTADNNLQNTALLPWDGGNGEIPDLVPNMPSLSLPSLPDSFPDALKVFENIMKGGVWPDEPDCDDGLFSFCCESGPPKSKIKKGTSADRILEIEAERKQRLRKCVKWNKHHPVCQFPENEACCVCLSLKHYAFYCYNPHWRANPTYNGMPQPPTRPIPVLEPNPDFAPFDDGPDPNPSSQKEKRVDLWEDVNMSERDDYTLPLQRRRPLSANNFEKRNPPEEEKFSRRPGPPRAEYMCSNEFLESVGIVPARPRWDPSKPSVMNKKPQQQEKRHRRKEAEYDNAAS